MATFSDDFNRADGALGSNWATVGTRSMPTIVSSRFAVTSAPSIRAAAVATSAATFTADHEATITVAVLGSADFLGPAVRVDATNGTGYMIYTDGTNSSNRRIYEFTNAGISVIGGVNIPCMAGDTLTLRAVGTTITALKNGVVVDTLTGENTYSTGQPGIFYERGNNGTSRGDDFTASDISSGPSPAVLARYRRMCTNTRI